MNNSVDTFDYSSHTKTKTIFEITQALQPSLLNVSKVMAVKTLHFADKLTEQIVISGIFRTARKDSLTANVA